jgi:signal transduction histidine kinase/CheY-like chemotaxis protein
MYGDQQSRDIEDDLASALYGADPISFLTHCVAIALLTGLCFICPEAGPLLFLCVLFYGAANCLAIALWAAHRYRPASFSTRRWINFHAISNVVLHGAPALSIWFAIQNESSGLASAHVLLLCALAALAFVANGLHALNFLSAVLTLLLPATALYLIGQESGRFELGIVLVFFAGAILLYATHYSDVFRDIVMARVDQQRLAQNVARQKEAVEEASATRTRFFAAASHDLRQPLHAIGLLAHGLTDAAISDADRDQMARHIIGNVEALNDLLSQVLDLSRIEGGVTQVMPQHFLITEMLARIDLQFRPVAAAKGLALRIAPTVDTAYTDPVLIERIIANLVSNAIRYTEHGSVWIGVRRGDSRGHCFIEVRDSGIGIAAIDHERVFEEFFQVPIPSSSARPGHGLGLSTVKRLTRLLGEELTLRSSPGRGTTIRVSVRTGDASLVATRLAVPLDVSTFIEGRCVLCVDDDSANLDALDALLTRWGCSARGCRDELAAVRAISEGFVPDVLLCDYRADRHQVGIEALQAVREAMRRRGHDEPACVMITGDQVSPEVSQLAANGVPVLHKPVTPTRLRRTLDSVLRPHTQENEAA